MPRPPLFTVWCSGRAQLQPVPAVVVAVMGLEGESAPLEQIGTVKTLSPWSRIACVFFLSSSFVWLYCCVQPQGGKGRREIAAAPLISAKLYGCLPLALCYASTAPLAALSYSSLVHTDIPLGRICLWWAYRKVCHHLRERGWIVVATEKKSINTYNLDMFSY